MAMSSMYTESHPCATSIRNMEFIIIWKVAGELVRLKNMTSGLKSPAGVSNAAFHLSPCLIRMLLYPYLMLSLVKSVHPISQLMVWGISGDTFLFHLVYFFRGR
jgi:hypothetical protein